MKVLRNANAAPEWVEFGKDVRKSVAEFRDQLHMDVEKLMYGQPSNDVYALQVLQGWAALEVELQTSMKSLNALIHRYNSMTPTAAVHMVPLRLDAELKIALNRRKQ